MDMLTKKFGKAEAYAVAYRHESLYKKFGCDDAYIRLRPAMLVIPGGGYNHVSPREAEPVAIRYLALGFDVFILYYSVGLDIGVSNPFDEAVDCMRWIRSLEGIDPGKVSCVGFSAGGHLAALLSCYGGSDRPDALVLSYPVITMKEGCHAGSRDMITMGDISLRNHYSVEDHVDGAFPPTYIWTTADDASVDPVNSILMFQALKKAGVCSSLHIFANGVHGLSVANRESGKENPAVSVWLDESVGFLKHVLDISF